MKKLLFPILLLATLFTSCQKIILGEDEVNTPKNNFDIFWEDFDRHYGLFTVRGWDWDSIRMEYEGQVTPETTDEELFTIFSEMIDYLDDRHTFVYWPGRKFFASGDAGRDQVREELSLDLIVRNYVDVRDSSSVEEYLYGDFRGRDIGYFHLSGIDLEDTGLTDQILRDIGHHQAIIIDLRNNTGGADQIGVEIAGRFIQEEKLLYTVQERNGPKHDDFAEKKEYFSRRIGTENFNKPVVVLTDQVTISAGEVMLLYLKSIATVTQIGDVTSGDFSDTGMRRFLPNGMQYRYSIMKFLLPDGTSLDGVGHVPDIYARNTVEDIAAGNDVVLERAFTFLLEEYGIR
ncbi:S41 family peptidase [Neolewinella persica]|uniref:S41 family peptidase n=1 Tax=Neolewinella persica TaxID=70998 RepID=UPI00036E04B7|nr:S41 family peptidase [Neolewinella persica]